MRTNNLLVWTLGLVAVVTSFACGQGESFAPRDLTA
ncbi:MAG: hypothetical protein IMHGJWDQ_001755, partial [Candidatus Fervidibacter sp.]